MTPPPRQMAGVGLIAIVPVIAYAVGNVDVFAAVAAGNVVLIVGSLAVMLREPEPVEHSAGVSQ